MLEARLRYSGLALEMLGVFTVVHGLRAKGRLFNKPSIRALLARALKTFPKWPGRQATIHGSAGIALGGMKVAGGSMSVWHGAADQSLERRVEALEKNLESLRQDHRDAVKDLREADDQLRRNFKSESADRRTSDQELRRKIEGIGAESLHIEVMGVLWIVVGVVLATASAELATLLRLF
jgi:hypothetical protein